jgi:putative ABC transport system permease protein
VAGVWRDYARQFGAIVVDRQAYRLATGDDAVTDVALWLAHDARPEATMAALRALPSSPPLEIASATAMRIRALAVFDRSFAVTYLLEAVAMGIGLIGIAAAFGAQTLARIKEFGMLRHLGVSRREILWLLAAEGLILTTIGTLAGLALGFAVALVLIHVVNPQSFHWTMDLHLPVALLASIALALLACAALSARVAGRAAAASPALLAVREDW